MAIFADRVDAGRQLGNRLIRLRRTGVVVLGLPRGGVPVAAEVANALDAALDVIVVRKLGVPGQPELAMGAIGEEGTRWLDEDVLSRIRVSPDQLSAVERRERTALDARVAQLRRGRDRVDLSGRAAVIVDDGLATGSTARVACRTARRLGAIRVMVAVPVAPRDGVTVIAEADALVCLARPAGFMAVSSHYGDFSATSDAEVLRLLDAAAGRNLG